MKYLYIMLITAALALASAPQEAVACSCSSDLRFFPGDGASDVPLNVKPALFQRSSFWPDASFSLRVAGEREVVPVLVTSRERERHRDTLITLEPVDALASGTDYEVLAGEAVVSTFQTGQRLDGEAPEATPLASFSVETMDKAAGGGNSCVDGYDSIFGRLRVEYPDLPKDAAYFVLHMRSEETEYWTEDWILLSRAWELEPLSIADFTCSPNPHILRPGRRYCASLVAVDLAGNVSASTAEVCAIAKACHFDIVGDGFPSEQCREVTDSGTDERHASGCSVVQASEHSAAYLLIGLWGLCWRRKATGGHARLARPRGDGAQKRQ